MDNLIKYYKTWAIVHGRIRRKGIPYPRSKWVASKILSKYKKNLLESI